MALYEENLVLCATELHHASTGRMCLITYALDDSASHHSAQAVANIAQDAFADIWQPQLDTSVTIGPTTVSYGEGDATPSEATSNIANVVATRALSSIPPNSNMLLKKRTGTGGRRNRGRCYLPWSFDEAGIDEIGILSSGEVSGAQTRATAWLARLVTDGTPMVIANRVYDSPWTNPERHLTDVILGHAVTALLVDTVIASQRRRIGR